MTGYEVMRRMRLKPAAWEALVLWQCGAPAEIMAGLR